MKMNACVVCGNSEAKSALPLIKEDGLWVAKPVCDKCRSGLYKEARAAGKILRLFGLEGSLKETEKRNSESARFRPFLDVFAKAKRDEAKQASKRKNGDQRKLVNV